MKAKAIAALGISLLLAGATVALAQQQTPIFQYGGELQCTGIDYCSVRTIYEGQFRYEEFPYPAEGPTTQCICQYYMYTTNPAADAIGVDFEFAGGEDVCVGVDVRRPQNSAEFSSRPCGGGEQPVGDKDCAGNIDLCTWWCGGTCDEVVGFDQYVTTSPTVVLVEISNRSQVTESVDITVSVFALLNPSPTPTPPQPPQVLPQLNPEYFNPFPYNPNVDSPLKGIRIDFTFLARSVVTVINMVSAGGFLTWIAAFAVIFIILLAFINYILKRISGGG
jgi:hypothetical protein